MHLALDGRYRIGDDPLPPRPSRARRDHCRELRRRRRPRSPGCRRRRSSGSRRPCGRSRPVAFYTWSGLEQHSGTTQTIRAINVLYALLGCLDAPGGNVLFTPVPTNPIDGFELLAPEQRAKAIGLNERPLGPARFEFVTGPDVYTAALDGRARALVNFGAEPGDGPRRQRPRPRCAAGTRLHGPRRHVPQPDGGPGRHRPSGRRPRSRSRHCGSGSRSARRPSHSFSCGGRSTRRVGEARSDLEIVFALATRLGLGEHFWDGDIDAAWRHQLAAERDHGRAAPRAAGRDQAAAHHHPPQARPARRRHPGRVPHPVGKGRAAVRNARRPRLPGAANVHRAGDQPALAARPCRPLPACAHVRQVGALRRVPAPADREAAPRDARPTGRDPPRRRRRRARSPPETGCGS